MVLKLCVVLKSLQKVSNKNIQKPVWKNLSFFKIWRKNGNYFSASKISEAFLLNKPTH